VATVDTSVRMYAWPAKQGERPQRFGHEQIGEARLAVSGERCRTATMWLIRCWLISEQSRRCVDDAGIVED